MFDVHHHDWFPSPPSKRKRWTPKKTRTQEIDLSASTALDVGFENQRIVKGKFSLQALETAMLPAHTTVAGREVLHRMLDPDPREPPSRRPWRAPSALGRRGMHGSGERNVRQTNRERALGKGRG